MISQENQNQERLNQTQLKEQVNAMLLEVCRQWTRKQPFNLLIADELKIERWQVASRWGVA